MLLTFKSPTPPRSRHRIIFGLTNRNTLTKSRDVSREPRGHDGRWIRYGGEFHEDVTRYVDKLEDGFKELMGKILTGNMSKYVKASRIQNMIEQRIDSIAKLKSDGETRESATRFQLRRQWGALEKLQDDILNSVDEEDYNQSGVATYSDLFVRMERTRPLRKIPNGLTKMGAIRDKEREFRMLDHEKAYAVDRSGNVVFEMAGGEDYVVVNRFYQERLRRSKGVVFTHNHPAGWKAPSGSPVRAGNSFSQEDIALAIRLKLGEIRAIGPECLYSLKPGPMGWGSDGDVIEAFRNIDWEIGMDLHYRVETRQLTPEEATLIHSRERAARMADAMGWEYTETVLPQSVRKKVPINLHLRKSLAEETQRRARDFSVMSFEQMVRSRGNIYLDASQLAPRYVRG